MPTGETQCPACAIQNARSSLRPETVLSLCFPALVCFFVFTSFAVRRYNDKEQALGEEWFAKARVERRARKDLADDGGLTEALKNLSQKLRPAEHEKESE
jgi:hypothetical protein